MASYGEIIERQAKELEAYRNMTKNILLHLKYPENVLFPSGVTSESEIIEMIDKLTSKIKWYERTTGKSDEGFINNFPM